VEPLFLFATLLQQPRLLGSRPVLGPSLCQRQVEQEGIHIIPAELRDPGAADHLVAAGRHADDGGIEGPTTEIIHHHQFAAGARPRTAGMMGIFDARRGRLIEEPADPKAGAAEGLHCQEALVTIGVRGDGDHGLQDLMRGDTQVGALHQVTPQLGEKRGQQLQEVDGAGAQRHLRRGSQCCQMPLVGTQQRPVGVVLVACGVQPIEACVATRGDQGRIPVLGVASGGVKTDHWVIAPIDRGHDGTSGAVINTEQHGVLLSLS
jgi:hypothetical protein